MSLKAIDKITQAEHDAQKCIEDAHTNAREIVSQAQRTAALDYDAAIKQSAEKTAALLEQAKHRGEDIAAKQLTVFQNECNELHQKALSRMDSAVAAVMERVVG